MFTSFLYNYYYLTNQALHRFAKEQFIENAELKSLWPNFIILRK